MVRTSVLALTAGFLLLMPVAAFGQSSSALQFGAAPASFAAAPLMFSVAPATFASAPVQTETATTIEVTLPADILFDFDKSEVRATAQPALHELALLLKDKARGP